MVLKSVLVSFFYKWLTSFPTVNHLLKKLSFFLYILASFVKDKVSVGMWIYLWASYFVPLICISLFVPVPYCLDDYGFVAEPEVRQVDSSSSILLSQDCFGYSRFFFFFLYFHANCEIICSSSVKNTVGSLIGIALNLYIALDNILIFTVLILPIQEHGIFLHLFVSSLIYFISSYCFLYTGPLFL